MFSKKRPDLSATRVGGRTRQMSVTEWNRWTQRCVEIPSGLRAVEFSLVCPCRSYLVMHASLAWARTLDQPTKGKSSTTAWRRRARISERFPDSARTVATHFRHRFCLPELDRAGPSRVDESERSFCRGRFAVERGTRN